MQNTFMKGGKEITIMAIMRKNIKLLVEGADEYAKSRSRNSRLALNIAMNWWF